MKSDQGEVVAGQYLTFVVRGEEYGIEILRVREIIEVKPITRVPGLPRCIRGVINLRGTVVPVVDLACRFGLGDTQISKWTCVVVLDVRDEDQASALGLLVDSVDRALDLTPDDVEPPPAFGLSVSADLIEGLAKRAERFVLLLNVDRVIAPSELSAPSSNTHAESSQAAETSSGGAL